MLGAVVFGHEQMQAAIKAINELADEVNPVMFDWAAPVANEELIAQVRAIAGEQLANAFRLRQKQARTVAINEAWDAVKSGLINENTDTLKANEIKGIFKGLEAEIVRGQILAGDARIDGRDTRTVRPISIRNNVLPRTHGSALFTRGETQAMVVTTLGTKQDEQIIDALAGEYTERFMLHYNFPPYSTGEAAAWARRSAVKSATAVWPSARWLPCCRRNRNSVTRCAWCRKSPSPTVLPPWLRYVAVRLSLLSAGVPLKAHVAGIAMGLILEGNRFAVLTDILGDEDHLGDMDFKVAGTAAGVTALQMDIKIQGITKEIMQVALDQAKEGRMHILGLMKEAVEGPQELSAHAPRLYVMKINPTRSAK